MTEFRPFRNNDSPALAEVWRSQPPLRGLMQPVTPAVLEQFVFSKLYFDQRELILAERDGRVLGFVHVGFGPDERGSWTGTEVGVVSLVMIRPAEDERDTAAGLIDAGVRYLRNAGVAKLYAGGAYPNSPYYLGLYGGSDTAGVLTSDTRCTQWVQDAGFRGVERHVILQCRLAGWRPSMNRQQLLLRRKHKLECIIDPPPSTWWEANRAAQHDLMQFRVESGPGPHILASVTYWDMEPLASGWGMMCAGLLELNIAGGVSEEGLDQFILAESMKQLQNMGIQLVEAQVRESETARRQLLEALGFTEVDAGVVYALDV